MAKADKMIAENAIDKLAIDLTRKAEEYKEFRDIYTEHWIDIYYNYIGKYKPGRVPSESWRTKSFIRLAKQKTLAVYAQMIQPLLTVNNPIEVIANDSGEEQAARGMASTINEQFERADYPEKVRIAALEQAMYGPCYIQAPAVVPQITRRWKLDLLQSFINRQKTYAPTMERNLVPSMYNRNIFEMFPYPFATSLQSGEGIIHRPFISKYELADLAGKPGFNKAIIKALLGEGPRESGNEDGTEQKFSARGYTGKRKGYDLIFYAGKMDAKDILAGAEAGLKGFPKQVEGYLEVLAWVITGTSKSRLLKIRPNPFVGKRRPFFMSVQERVPYEVMGEGVGGNIKDLVDVINGAVRLLMDGKKMTMPQIALNTGSFPPGTKVKFRPFKVWQFNGDPRKSIYPLAFPDTTTGLIELIELCERYLDEVSAPKWTTGVDSKMLNKTATGMSMLMNASAQLTRTAIENLIEMIEGIGEAFYDWNMMYHPDPNIKGDFTVSAGGLYSMMQKEILNEQLFRLFTLVANPGVYANPYALKLARMIAENMQIKNVDDILPDPDKIAETQNMTPDQTGAMLAGVSSPEGGGLMGGGNFG